MTTGFVQRCFIPLHFASEQETIEMAIASLGRIAAKDLRLMIIPTTLHLEKVYVSEALVPELKARPGVEVASEGGGARIRCRPQPGQPADDAQNQPDTRLEHRAK